MKKKQGITLAICFGLSFFNTSAKANAVFEELFKPYHRGHYA
ncbi:hypothetical protein [Paenibacillus sp. DMB20]|nr:hypothetical protein [Paenibacillus sp. DMB20]